MGVWLCLLAATPIVVQTVLGVTRVWPDWRHNIHESWYADQDPFPDPIPDPDGYYITSFFCERLYSFDESPYFCQLANGLTSYAFLAPALYVAWISRPELSKHFLRELTFVAANVWNTFGNLAYHAFCNTNGMEMDCSGFTWVLANLTTLSWYHLWNQHPWSKSHQPLPLPAFALVYCGTMTLLASLGEWWGFDVFGTGDMGVVGMYVVYGSLMLLPTMLVVAWHPAWQYTGCRDWWITNWKALAALLSIALGFTAWALQQLADLCWERSWFQFHALWHIGTACAIGFFYAHLQSNERRRHATRVRRPSTIHTIPCST